MEPEPADSSPRPVLPRSAIILLTLACAAVVAFGLAAMRGIVTPVFFAFVLTLCVHPLRRWMQGRGVPRGLATGIHHRGRLCAAGRLRRSAGCLARPVLRTVAAIRSPTRRAGRLHHRVLESVGFGPEQTQAVLDGFTPGRIIGFLGGVLGNITSIVGSLVVILTMLILMAVDGSRMPAVLTHLNYHRPDLVTAFNDFGARRPPVHGRHDRPRSSPGPLQLAGPGHPAGPGRPAVGVAVLHLQLHSEHRLLHCDRPARCSSDSSPAAGRPSSPSSSSTAGSTAVIQSIIQPKYVGNAVALSETITFASVLFWAVILGPVGAILAVPLTLLCPHDPPRLRPGHRVVAALDR